MFKLVPPTKSLSCAAVIAAAFAGQAAFAGETCSELDGELTNIEFVVATDASVAKARASEIARGVLLTWFEKAE